MNPIKRYISAAVAPIYETQDLITYISTLPISLPAVVGY
jgi:hypothetical protein